MQLRTSRLLLRDIVLADLDFIHRLLSLPQTDEFNTLGIPETLAETAVLLTGWIKQQQQPQRNAYTFVMINQLNNSFVGLIALEKGKEKFSVAKIWYKLHVSQWRQGFATEAVQAILDFGFTTLLLHRIEAGCAAGNHASARVLQKAGMQPEGIKRKALPIRGVWTDSISYAILSDDVR